MERKKAEVSEEEVDNFLENLRERTATWRVVEEGEAEDGDLVIIDFTGYVDGEPLQGGRVRTTPWSSAPAASYPVLKNSSWGQNQGRNGKFRSPSRRITTTRNWLG